MNQVRWGNGSAGMGRRLTEADEVITKAAPMQAQMASPSPLSTATVLPVGSQVAAMASSPLSKAGDWKTIDQRERHQRRDRKIKRIGLAAAGTGAGAIGYATANHPGGARGVVNEAKSTVKDFRKDPVRDAAFRTLKYRPGGGLALGGAALLGGGLAAAAGARGMEGYHQRKVNQRRRGNHARVSKSSTPMWISEDGSNYRAATSKDSGREFGRAGDVVYGRRVKDKRASPYGLGAGASLAGSSLAGSAAFGAHGRNRAALAGGAAAGLIGGAFGITRSRQHTGTQVINARTGEHVVVGRSRFQMPKGTVTKAVSDPEAQRQRRLGATAGIGAVGGAGSLAAGVKGVKRDTHAAQGYRQNTERFKNVGPQGRDVMSALGSGRKGVKAVVLSRGNALKLLGGGAAVGGSAAIARHASKPNDQWY